MTIRFSTFQLYNSGLQSMLDLQGAASKTQQQIATGKRVLTPGDDPIASTRILQLTQELELNALYTNNAQDLQNRLERQDVALSNISDLLQRAQELVIQTGDAALAQEQRQFIAIEMQGLVESMAIAMNSRDGNGNYIFAGSDGRNPPYVKGADGSYDFVGDDGR
jgi:flagellar hook-associated protein 3 FlgL